MSKKKLEDVRFSISIEIAFWASLILCQGSDILFFKILWIVLSVVLLVIMYIRRR